MNNSLSLHYFIPEFILLLNVFFLFFSLEIKQRHLIKNRQILLVISIVTVIAFNLIRLFDHPRSLFYGSFVLDPFSNIFSVVLLFVFLIFELPDIWKSWYFEYTSDILQKLIILFASILLVKANSMIGFLLCSGLIYISNSILMSKFSHTNTDNKQITTDLTIQILVFGMLIFGFSIVYSFTGSLFFNNTKLPSEILLESPLNYCFLVFFLIFGFGHFGIILPFKTLQEKHHQIHYTRLYSSSYFLPFIAFFGSLIRILNNIIPKIGHYQTIPDEYRIFVIGLSVCLITGANFYYFKKKTNPDLFIIALIIHYGLIISSLAVFTIEALTASIYLIISTTIALAGIILLQKSDKISTQSKLLKTVFYLGLIGMPGTPGFSGRFLLIRSLVAGGVALWLIVLLIFSIFPIIYFYTVEIINLQRTKTVYSGRNIISIPVFLLFFSLLIVIYWEPFIQLITKSLVFLS